MNLSSKYKRLIPLLLIVILSLSVRVLTANFLGNHLNDPGWFQSGSYALFDRQAQDVLDGKEYDFTPPAPPNAPPPKGKRTSNWLPDGNGMIANEVTTAETPKGSVTTNIVKKWTFTAEGELTIAMFVDNPQVSYEAKRIFIRKK